MDTISRRPTAANLYGSTRVWPRVLHPVIAWIVVLAVFVIGYGAPTWGSLSTLLELGAEASTGARSEADRTAWIAVLLLLQFAGLILGVAAVLVVRIKHGEVYGSPLPLRAIAARPRRLTAVLIPVVMAIIATAFAIGMSLAEAGVVGDYTPRSSRLDGSLGLGIRYAVYSVVAGSMEEISVLLVPVVLLRASGHRWPTIYLSCIAMRLAFHVDYGLPIAAGLAIWAAMMVTLYRATQQILALLAAHGLYNGLGDLGGLLPTYLGGDAGEALGTAVIAVRWGLVATGVVIVIVFASRRLAAAGR